MPLAFLFQLFFFVLILKGRYNGQNPIRLVAININASTIKTMPRVPDMVFVKNKPAIINATTNRMVLSAAPIFNFIAVVLS